MNRDDLIQTRRAGVLMHVTSLPGGAGNGDLGESAHRFVDVIADAGFSVWQTLPLCPTGDDLSPYQSPAANAGNPLLVEIGEAEALAGLDHEAPPARSAEVRAWRVKRLAECAAAFSGGGGDEGALAEFENFCQWESQWLEPYALFATLKSCNEQRAWWDWPEDVRDYAQLDTDTLKTTCAAQYTAHCFVQWVFQRQWRRLRDHAQARGVLLFGDLPIFVSEDSAEVWARPDLFELGPDGRASRVAGVPPDYFSATGQRWGNPLYDWSRMAAEDHAWWVHRMGRQFELFDMVRIDHFRGFESYWAIPAECETAMDGSWQSGPGDDLFKSLTGSLGPRPVVAEDLGIITPEVDALRHRHGLPGMKVLQFAFDGGPGNPYLPHNHDHDYVVYTGTHDNDTTAGWADSLDAAARQRVEDYLGAQGQPLTQALWRAALSSVCALAVTPVQDLLELGAGARMNTPGTTEGNWVWRLDDLEALRARAPALRTLNERYGRLPT
ncbi:MAG: 4-alpha-glucanotransferase [Gammaproteobacteria bacterium]